MGKTKYFILLSDEDVKKLKSIADDPGSDDSSKAKAEILLSLNGKKSNYTIVDHLAFSYGVSKSKIYRLMDRYNQIGSDSVNRRLGATARKPYKVTEEIEKKIVSCLHTPPPNGRKKWSAYMLADKVVEDGLAEKMSHTTIYRILAKLGLKC